MKTPNKQYVAGDIKATKTTYGEVAIFQATIHSPDGLEVIDIKSRQREMVRIAAGATVVALNKAMGV